MFGRDRNGPPRAPADEGDGGAPPLKPFSRRGSHTPTRATPPNPDAARRLAPSIPPRRAEPSRLDASDARRLVVGREICLSGEITSCDKLVVEGRVEATIIGARAVEVMPGGVFRGRAEVDEVDVAGLFEGEMIAGQRLTIRSGGRVSGSVRYGRIIIESGGEIAGEMQALTVVGPSEGDKIPRALPAPGSGPGPSGDAGQ